MSLLTKNDTKIKTDADAALAEAVAWAERRQRNKLQASAEYGTTQALISIAASLRELVQKK